MFHSLKGGISGTHSTRRRRSACNFRSRKILPRMCRDDSTRSPHVEEVRSLVAAQPRACVVVLSVYYQGNPNLDSTWTDMLGFRLLVSLCPSSTLSITDCFPSFSRHLTFARAL